MRKRSKWIFLGIGLLLVSYVLLYIVNTSLGGYNPNWASDGRHSFPASMGGLFYHDCIMWEPRLGTYDNKYRHDFVGSLFCPLIVLDRRFVHKTHTVWDKDFGQWWGSLSEQQLHPDHRNYFRSSRQSMDSQ